MRDHAITRQQTGSSLASGSRRSVRAKHRVGAVLHVDTSRISDNSGGHSRDSRLRIKVFNQPRIGRPSGNTATGSYHRASRRPIVVAGSGTRKGLDCPSHVETNQTRRHPAAITVVPSADRPIGQVHSLRQRLRDKRGPRQDVKPARTPATIAEDSGLVSARCEFQQEQPISIPGKQERIVAARQNAGCDNSFGPCRDFRHITRPSGVKQLEGCRSASTHELFRLAAILRSNQTLLVPARTEAKAMLVPSVTRPAPRRNCLRTSGG